MMDYPKKLEGNRDTYYIKRHLATGGMGEVLEGVDSSERPVAIKIPLNYKPNRNGDPVNDQLQNEINNLKIVTHPNIVKYYDDGVFEQNIFLVMEMVKGKSVKDLVEGGEFEYAFAKKVSQGIANALGYLRRYRIVHRDVSPVNLIISESDDIVKLIDFSTSVRLGEDEEYMRIRGSKVGTANFSAPEQFTQGLCYIDSDVYSLGANAYYCLTGNYPEKIKNDLKAIKRFEGLSVYEVIRKTLQIKREDRERDIFKLIDILKGK
ncbi:serine/threonine-protein kinase [Caldiplasma sukawensis]